MLLLCSVLLAQTYAHPSIAFAWPARCIHVAFFLQVREYVTRELAQRLRPELEAAVKANDSSE